MLPQKGKKMLYWFLFIYAVFGLMIIYLFMFVPGLEILEEFNEAENTKEVYVYNSTDRVINNVSIKFRTSETDLTEKDLNKFSSLGPKEKKLVALNNLAANTIILSAHAPFHATIEKLIVLRNKDDTTIKLNFPSEIFFGKTFGFSIELCNNTNKEEEFKITESHESAFFSEPGKTDTSKVGVGECTKISYSLTTLEKGDTTIYFNVKSSNTNEDFEQKITVE